MTDLSMLMHGATRAVKAPQSVRLPPIARVALARGLLTLCLYALRDEQGCRAHPLSA